MRSEAKTVDNRPIGVMDSGLGGLTFVKEMRRQVPNESIIFLGDEARLPYGVRPPEEVYQFSYQIAQYLMTFDIKMFVIACNTATAAALPYLQAQLDIPVVGVIKPGSTAAVKASNNQQIGVIATQKTIESAAYTQQIHQINSDERVIGLAAQELVTLVEQDQMGTKMAATEIQQKLTYFEDYQIDTLILGCTHFPLLAPEIKAAIGPDVKLIDSGAATVEIVNQTLQKLDAKADENNQTFLKLFTTGSAMQFEKVATKWLEETQLDLNTVELGE